MNRLLSAILLVVLLPSLIANPSKTLIKKDNGKRVNIGPWSEFSEWKTNKDTPSAVNWNDDVYRLPGDLLPSSYTIRLLPFLDEGNFTTDGFIEILVDCVADTDSIVMNSRDISINVMAIWVLDLNTNNPVAVVDLIDEQKDYQKITIKTAATLQSGNQYKISMKFISYLMNDQFNGFYLSSYVENDVVKYLAASHMEPNHARVAFPCFDEPDMKAEFSIILGRKESMTSSSNMPLSKTEPNEGMPGYVWDSFEKTPIMSTYLVALMVSEFTATPSDSSLSNVQFRIISRPDFENETAYAADVGPRILEYFETYFGVEYPLAKEDMAAIPDFGPGAMENWGHINYKESLLLVGDETTSIDKQTVAEVIAHELAHQWFGDLVTMEWWNVIWLNEGFARYLQYLGVNAVEPSYRMLEQFPVNTLQNKAFVIDALQTSHPMSQPKERSHIFDSIEYDKGGSVLRMCSSFLGEETFKSGLNRYLTQNEYNNTGEDDLWNTLDYQAAVDGVILPASLIKIMGSWTQNKNYPLIKITRDYSGDIDGALVEQQRFVIPDSNGITDPTPTPVWWVPLTYTHNFSETSTTAWLSSKSKKLVSLAATKDEWVIFNVDQTGFYRVTYDPTNYGLISDQLVADHSQISIINRAQLLDDAFNLAKINIIPYNLALDLTMYLEHESEYIPWHAVVNELDYIDIMFYNELEYSDWKNYMTTLVEPYYNTVGFEESESDEHLTILSRGEALKLACRFKLAGCVENVNTEYAALMAQPDKKLSPNQRNFILCTGVENGQQPEYDFAFDQYKLTDDNGFLVAMTCTQQISIINDLLNNMLDDTLIRSDDVDTLFTKLAANPVGNSLALEFLTTRWQDINDTLGPDHFVVFFRSLCNRLNKQSEYDQMEKLRDDHSDILGSSSTVEEGLEVIRINIQWLEGNQEEISMWLLGGSSTASSSTTTKTTSQSSTQSTTSQSSTQSTTIQSSTQSTTSQSSTQSTTIQSSTQSTTSSTQPTTKTTPVPSTTVPPTTPSSGYTIQSRLVFTFVCVAMGIMHF